MPRHHRHGAGALPVAGQALAAPGYETVEELDELLPPMPYHPLGLAQSWYPPADAAALGIDLTAQPGYAEILAARTDRMAVMRRIVAGLSNTDLGRGCQRSPAPGYPEEERAVAECIAVVMDEEIEHYRFAVRDLAVLEALNVMATLGWSIRRCRPSRSPRTTRRCPRRAEPDCLVDGRAEVAEAVGAGGRADPGCRPGAVG